MTELFVLIIVSTLVFDAVLLVTLHRFKKRWREADRCGPTRAG